jgi:hypothetical protein
MDAPSPSTPPPSAPSTSGLVYADVPNRVIAYIIDAIIIGLITAVIGAILGGMGLGVVTINPDFSVSVNYVAAIIQGIVGLVIGAG